MKAEIKISRFIFTEKSTISELYFNGTRIGYTLEDKDRNLDNSMTLEKIKSIKEYGVTAIPTGVYEAKLFNSPKHGDTILLEDVKGFSMIEMHVGNFPSDSLGCLLVGSSFGTDVVKNSKATIKKLIELVKDAESIIVIIFRKTSIN